MVVTFLIGHNTVYKQIKTQLNFKWFIFSL